VSGLRIYRYYVTLRLLRAVVRRLRRYTEQVAAKVAATPYN
jgi:hypothetical protein